ncbi:MAG: hypothetical protein A2086_17175 [Spirochaetes bacterium GWD1_27_9]|nr:MAG: hypothetical protein A2Z98_02635 [Spirochaetes bacterium GWB1_27_13]OHD27316.1 MAG: hypothetical protein A2Y34_15960 [Spirochaetes bacterium GWC1_27_15]OHD34178.1 MAG: hypothetical protein A2086_17175 [Spirochaetes bacterium GWD1_27_9]
MTIICSIIRTIFYLITINLRFSKKYYGKTVLMDDGLKFKIFRHIKLESKKNIPTGSIFIVRFKFKKFSHKTNMITSIIPIPSIAGFPNFRDKIWMIDWETGYWQGLYQWDNTSAIEKYKKSFVLGIMNKRSIKSSLSYKIIPDVNFEEYLKSILVN